LRRPPSSSALERPKPGTSTELRTTPAADSSLSEAARLAGSNPVGSHHLLLAALGDPDTAAAKALADLGVDLDQAREALRSADVTGTSDEPPEEAGRRQMVIHVTDDKLTIEATDPVILEAGRAALRALGKEAETSGTIRGDQPTSDSLAKVWQALQDSLGIIHRRATLPAAAPLPEPREVPDKPGPEVA
jgi:ATP-dependent Clp protease ATP-binding subunit ClpA